MYFWLIKHFEIRIWAIFFLASKLIITSGCNQYVYTGQNLMQSNALLGRYFCCFFACLQNFLETVSIILRGVKFEKEVEIDAFETSELFFTKWFLVINNIFPIQVIIFSLSNVLFWFYSNFHYVNAAVRSVCMVIKRFDRFLLLCVGF